MPDQLEEQEAPYSGPKHLRGRVRRGLRATEGADVRSSADDGRTKGRVSRRRPRGQSGLRFSLSAKNHSGREEQACPGSSELRARFGGDWVRRAEAPGY